MLVFGIWDLRLRDIGMLSVSVPRLCVAWVWVGWFWWNGCGLAPSLEHLTPELVGTPSREYLSGVNILNSQWCIRYLTRQLRGRSIA